MALDYEVRPEFKSLSLDKLLDNSIMCFQGVGDTQNDLLDKYFGIKTIKQLAKMPFFLWALGIQELALRGGETGNKAVNELSKEMDLKFSIRDNEQGKTPRELLKAPVNVLDGLKPGQNLALYDAFRITNIAQLAQNRIMLEARVIEYIDKHGGEMDPSSTANKNEIASILGSDTFVPSSGAEAQKAMLSDIQDPGLQKMATELGEHLRGRIDALKDRAAEKAHEISNPDITGSSSEEINEEAGKIRQETGPGGANRLDALREVRQRTEITRVQTITSRPGGTSAADRLAAIEKGREGPPITPDAGMEDADTPHEAAGTEGGEKEELATSPGMTIQPHTDEMAEAEEGTAEGGEEISVVEEEETPSKLRPWMAAAAVVLIILIVAIWMMSPDEEPAPPVATETESMLPQVAETTQPVEQVAEVPPEPEPEPLPPIRTIHNVVKGQSLWRISRKYYRRGSLWPGIYDVNMDQIEDPDLIFPKQQFKIPE